MRAIRQGRTVLLTRVYDGTAALRASLHRMDKGRELHEVRSSPADPAPSLHRYFTKWACVVIALEASSS
jgi:hypothetical protein